MSINLEEANLPASQTEEPTLSSETSSEGSSVQVGEVTPASPDNLPLTPDEIEAAIVEQTMAGGGQKSPQDLYAQLFYLYIPKFKNEVRGMSNKQLRRLLSALIETPLNTKPYKMMEVGERMVFQMASNLLEAKFGMMLSVMAEKQRKEQEAAQLSIETVGAENNFTPTVGETLVSADTIETGASKDAQQG